MESGNFALSPNGLTREQIDAILATRFPPDKPVSVAVFYIVKGSYYGGMSYYPVPAIVRRLNDSDTIKRIVPIPEFLLPSPLTLDAVQQIGIRTLSEYSLIFYGDASKVFFSYKSPFGHYMISSTLEYLMVDNRTTAIIASDKLFSEMQTPVEIFTDKEYQKQMAQMYEEQAKLLSNQLEALFKKAR